MTELVDLTREWGSKVTQSLLDLLQHAKEAADIVELGEYTYFESWLVQRAAEMVLVRAGESATRIQHAAPGFIEQYPDLELRALIDARNFAAHSYDRVEAAVIWDILSDDFPALATSVTNLLGITN